MNCIYSDKPPLSFQFMMPNIYNAYLPLIKYAPNLRTDSERKIYSKFISLQMAYRIGLQYRMLKL